MKSCFSVTRDFFSHKHIWSQHYFQTELEHFARRQKTTFTVFATFRKLCSIGDRLCPSFVIKKPLNSGCTPCGSSRYQLRKLIITSSEASSYRFTFSMKITRTLDCKHRRSYTYTIVHSAANNKSNNVKLQWVNGSRDINRTLSTKTINRCQVFSFTLPTTV